jgi:dUTP pyrophosphatase
MYGLSNNVYKKSSRRRKTSHTKGSEGAAGYDLYSVEDYKLKGYERKLFDTGIQIDISNTGLYGRIAPRSGLAYKYGIDVLAGVIDSDYRGNIGVILINLGREKFEIKKGDRIAQIIFESYNDIMWIEKGQLSNTERECAGFGSTGK